MIKYFKYFFIKIKKIEPYLIKFSEKNYIIKNKNHFLNYIIKSENCQLIIMITNNKYILLANNNN